MRLADPVVVSDAKLEGGFTQPRSTPTPPPPCGLWPAGTPQFVNIAWGSSQAAIDNRDRVQAATGKAEAAVADYSPAHATLGSDPEVEREAQQAVDGGAVADSLSRPAGALDKKADADATVSLLKASAFDDVETPRFVSFQYRGVESEYV